MESLSIRNSNTAIELKNMLTLTKTSDLRMDSTVPVITGIVPAASIGSRQAFTILGNKLLGSGVPAVITIQFAGKTP